MNAHVAKVSTTVRTRVSVVLAMLIVASAATTSAQARDDAPTLVVTYAGATAKTAAGAQQLYRRLQAAAREVCAPYQGRELAKLALFNTCYNQALSAAVANVNLASLRNVHRERGDIRFAGSPTRDDAAGG